MAGQEVPLLISVAPFPEGFQGDMDETWQQGVLLMSAFIEGNFLTGLILPPGSTLPSSDQGPIAMGGIWYFWDPASGQYLPQTISTKVAKNFAKNCCYQVQQTGSSIVIPTGITPVYDMSICRATGPNALSVGVDVGPLASADNDFIPSAIKYTVGPGLVSSPAATDLYAHEHIFEGSDIAMLQGQTLSLSFSVWTNTPGTYSVYLANSGRDHSFVSTFVLPATTWTRIKIPGISPMPTAVGTWNFGEGQTGLYMGVAMLVGSQWKTTILNSWQAVFAAGAAANTNLLTVVNNQLSITGIKLEASPTVSYLSVPAFATDFWDALRYYFTSWNYQSSTAGVPLRMMAHLAGKWTAQMLFPQRMCKAPTVVPYGYISYAPGNITDISVPTPIDLPVATLAATRKGISDSQTTAAITVTGTIGSVTGLTGTTANGSDTITALSSTASLSVGMPVSGTGIPAGALIRAIPSGTSIALTTLATAAGTAIALTFGTINVTSVSPNTTGLAVGQPISGTGVQPGTTIATIVSSSAINLSLPASPGTGVSLTTNPVAKGDVLLACITADARLT